MLARRRGLMEKDVYKRQDRIVLFDETRAFDSIIKAGLFPEFSNSFLVTAQKRGEQDA